MSIARNSDVALTGSGSLAGEILHAIARSAPEPLTVTVIGRDAARLERLVHAARGSAAAAGNRLAVDPVVVDWADEAQLGRAVAEASPRLVIHTASLQSPWTLDAGDAWSALVAAAGFGVTLPLQALLALRLGRAVRDHAPDARLFNCCYPDAVNGVLAANGIRVEGGAGNVAILASVLSGRVDATERLRVIGHHAHVAAAVQRTSLVSAPLHAWIGHRPIHEEAAAILAGVRLPRNLNDIVAASTLPLLFPLLGMAGARAAHCAAPHGLPGGYPVLVSRKGIELDLPPGVSREDAIAMNLAAAREDGVIVGADGEVVLTERARDAVTRFAGSRGGELFSWHARDVERIAQRLLSIRADLMPA